MHHVIEKIEAGVACLVPLTTDASLRNTQYVACHHLPAGVKEGDVMVEVSGTYQRDAQATVQRRQALQARMTDLFQRP